MHSKSVHSELKKRLKKAEHELSHLQQQEKQIESHLQAKQNPKKFKF